MEPVVSLVLFPTKNVEFHQSLEDAFPFGDLSKVKTGIACAGKQPGRNIWVLSKDVQIDEGRYHPKSNFAISLQTFVDAGDSTRYFALVTRKCDKVRIEIRM